MQLSDLHVVGAGLVPAPAVHVFAFIRRVAMLVDVDDRCVQLAVGTFGDQRQGFRQGGVGVLQGVEGQSRLAVLVVEQPHQLVDPVLACCHSTSRLAIMALCSV